MAIEFDNSGSTTDIFSVQAKAIVNPVNCVGKMGKGLALAFAQRYPAILPAYRQACDTGLLRPGRLLSCRLDRVTGEISETGDLSIVNFPTKDDWRAPSKIEWIDQGLAALADWIQENDVKSIAIPQLGCGLGGLAWKDVAALIDRHLGGLQGVRVHALGPDPELASAPQARQMIREFRDDYRWLSNMHRAPVLWGDSVTPARLWPCNELPYVLSKTIDPQQRANLIEVYETAEKTKFGTGAAAVKKAGASKFNVTLRADWEAVKIDIMTALVRDKFARNQQLSAKLIATGNAHIQEGNWWGDVFWGVATKDIPARGIKIGQGRNELGRILMETREALQKGELQATPVPSTSPAGTPNAMEPAGAMPKPGPSARNSLSTLPLPGDVVNIRTLTRSKNDPLPADVLNCSRYGSIAFRDGTKLENPYVMSDYGGRDGSREDVIRKFANDLSINLEKPGFADWLARTTSGKRLACFCAPQACHCDAIKAAASAIIQGKDPQEATRPYRELGLSQPVTPAEEGIYAGIGSRETPIDVVEKMQGIAASLAERGWRLRSGGADRADINFEKGCDTVKGKKDIFIPWASFEAKNEIATTGYRPIRTRDQVHVGVDQKALMLASKHHPAWERLTKATDGDWLKKPSPAQMLHARNGYQVLGRTLDRPADVIICYTKGGEISGGTGQALRLAGLHGIEIINLGSPRWINASIEQIVSEAEKFRGAGARDQTTTVRSDAAPPSAVTPSVRPEKPMPVMKNRGLMR